VIIPLCLSVSPVQEISRGSLPISLAPWPSIQAPCLRHGAIAALVYEWLGLAFLLGVDQSRSDLVAALAATGLFLIL